MSESQFLPGDRVLVFRGRSTLEGQSVELLHADDATGQARAAYTYFEVDEDVTDEITIFYRDLLLEAPARREVEEDFFRAAEAARVDFILPLDAWWAAQAERTAARDLDSDDLSTLAAESEQLQARLHVDAEVQRAALRRELVEAFSGLDRAEKVRRFAEEHARWTDQIPLDLKLLRAEARDVFGEAEAREIEARATADGAHVSDEARRRALRNALAPRHTAGRELRDRCHAAVARDV